MKWQGGPGHPTPVPLIRASRSGEHLARDGARWYTAARWGPHQAFSLSTECRSASGCHSAGRVCCHPVLHRSAGHRRALCGGLPHSGKDGWVVGSGRETGPRLKYAPLHALLTVALAGA